MRNASHFTHMHYVTADLDARVPLRVGIERQSGIYYFYRPINSMDTAGRMSSVPYIYARVTNDGDVVSNFGDLAKEFMEKMIETEFSWDRFPIW